MLLPILFISYAFCISDFQEIIDLTKESAKKPRILSDEFIKNENNQIKMPGAYQEKNVFYKLNYPIFATDSIIVKGLSIKNNLLGIIPSNHEEFYKIIQSFAVVDRKTKIIYKSQKLLEISDGVYVFLAKEEKFTTVFDITFVNMSYQKFEFECEQFGIKVLVEIKPDKSTHTNIFALTIGQCYDFDRDDEYSLDNIMQFDWPYLPTLGKWNDILKYLLVGQKIYIEVKQRGFLDGTLEFSAKQLYGFGVAIGLDKLLADNFPSKTWDFFNDIYVPSKSIEVFGISLGLECGFKISAFLKDITISLPKLRLIGGIYNDFKIAMNYDFKSKHVITNFRPIFKKPKFLYDVSILPDIEQLYVTFTFTPAIIPFYFKLDMPGVHVDADFGIEFPFVFSFKGNNNCTKLINFQLEAGIQLVASIAVDIPLQQTINKTLAFDIISKKSLIDRCITDYTPEYKANEIINAHDHDDDFEPIDPDKPDDEPIEKFKFTNDDIKDKSYTAVFTKPFEDGRLAVSLGFLYSISTSSLVFSIENGYILPEYATKLDDEDIYIMKIKNSYYENLSYYLPINFKRYKQKNVIFHFYGVYELYENNGDYICPKAFPVKSFSILSNVTCIGVESTPTMIQCCNDCDYNLCNDPIKKIKLGKKYYILTQINDFILQTNGNPYWIPEYHTFPTNLESFVIPADEYVYTPRVKCDRCSSVQFIINDIMYPSKHWAKTKYFSPKIPTNGYDYDPDIEDVTIDLEMNTLKGFANQSIKVIAICNSNEESYCYSKCIEPKGHSVIEIEDANGINVYSGDISKAAPENTYERNSLYQVIKYDNIPKNAYCSKSWNGKIKVKTLKTNKMTISIVDSTNNTKKIKAYLGNTYIPFSRTNYYSNIEQFLKDMGISIVKEDALSSDSNEQQEINYATLNVDGSVDVNADYFSENNLVFGEQNLVIDDSYISSVEIIHTEFVPKDSKKIKIIIIVCCTIGSVIIIVIMITIIIVVKRKKRKDFATVSQTPLISQMN